MKQYELTFIARDEQDPGVAAAIQAAGGEITSERTLGRRQFSYAIAKETAGYYTTFRFDAEPAILAGLTRTLELMNGVLRQLIVEVPERIVVAPSLDVEGLKEAKELGEAVTAAPEPEAKPETPAAKAERETKLQEQLDKLLGGDQNASQ